ncbi:hypothetical protein LRP88_07844 [Fusarium phalaenopsidis]
MNSAYHPSDMSQRMPVPGGAAPVYSITIPRRSLLLNTNSTRITDIRTSTSISLHITSRFLRTSHPITKPSSRHTLHLQLHTSSLLTQANTRFRTLTSSNTPLLEPTKLPHPLRDLLQPINMHTLSRWPHHSPKLKKGRAESTVQQPRRARMCGFGDKDRRPITPPPCVRLVIIDPATGKEVDYNDIDHTMFVLSVDLWNEDGTQEVNLVRSSTGTGSISSSNTYSYSTLVNSDPGISSYQQQGLPPSRDSGYGQSQGMGYVQDYPVQQGYGQGGGSYGPPQQYFPRHSGGYGNDAPVPPPPGQANMAPFRNGYGQEPNALTRMAVVGGQPQGMFTRNLIGSLAASAFRLCDTEERLGIWFVLQDLSVRTEGPFRLRFSFVNVGRPGGQGGPGSNVNQGRAPILSSCFSEVFNVYSAKKFPGVCESTSLSKTFAAQGIKIPIRKDTNVKGGDGGDDDYD